MDHKQNLSGVFAPITTPFFADGTIDFDGLKRNMERYAKSPLKGYLALGSNGENKSMLTEEKLRVLEIIVTEIKEQPHEEEDKQAIVKA